MRAAAIQPTRRCVHARARVRERRRAPPNPLRATIIENSDTSTEYTIQMTTEEARKCLRFDAIVVADNERAIFVSGVARDSSAEQCGIVPGQRLRALTNPVDKEAMMFLGDGQRLAFVKDAVRSTRLEELTFILEKEISVTQEMVAAAMSEEEREEEAMRAERARVKNETPTRRTDREGKKIKDRPDLYSDKWEGDEYTGSFWNELVRRARIMSIFVSRRVTDETIRAFADGGHSGGRRRAPGHHRARDDDSGGFVGRHTILISDIW